jgi:hypothetical protein
VVLVISSSALVRREPISRLTWRDVLRSSGAGRLHEGVANTIGAARSAFAGSPPEAIDDPASILRRRALPVEGGNVRLGHRRTVSSPAPGKQSRYGIHWAFIAGGSFDAWRV